MGLIDTHCHLDAPPLGDDQDGVLRRARAAGVETIVVPGTTLESSRQALALARAHSDVWAAVGIHPDADAELDKELDTVAFEALLADDRVIAVGEIGLDGSQGRARLSRQEERCRQQLELARHHGVPVLIHSRDATGRMLRLLQELGPVAPEGPGGPGGPGGILHAYAGSLEVAEQLSALGFCFGVGGVVTRPHARRIRAVIAALPLEQLVLETDAPFIGTATRPKGQVEPADLPEIAAALAEIHNQPLDVVAAVTSATARRVLQLPE